MYLFQKPRRRSINSNQLDFLSSAKIILDGGMEDIIYYRWGTSDKCILLNHGWESNTVRWRIYINRILKEGYSVIAADAPGHGLSKYPKFNIDIYANALTPLIKLYKPQIMIGHSAGGFASLLTGKKLQGHQPQKYILLAPNNDMLHVFETYRDMIKMRSELFEYIQTLVPDMNAEGHPISYFMSEKFIPSIDKPIIIIHDKEDDVLPYSESHKLDQMFDQVTLFTTEGLGHRLISNHVLDRVIEEVKKEIGE